jgi:hypothetical protein
MRELNHVVVWLILGTLMSHILYLLRLNHSVVAKGKMVGFMSVSDCRSGAYWV